MEIRKIIRKDGKGAIEATWFITEEQTRILLGYAIQQLVAAGLAFVTEMSHEDFKRLQEEADKEAISDFLSELDPNDMPEA